MKTAERYDSKADTLEHIREVQSRVCLCVQNLLDRAIAHDQSKLGPEEKPYFDEVTPMLKGTTYGSEEYRSNLRRIRPAIDHHNSVNSHHPEHFEEYVCPNCGERHSVKLGNLPEPGYPDADYRWCIKCYEGKYPGVFETAMVKRSGINGMSLLDLLEMVCDWKAATMRHADGNIVRSLEINQKRFDMTPQLAGIIRNTIAEMGWDQ